MRHNIREFDIRRKTQTKAISDFLRRVMPDTTSTSNRVPSPSAKPEPAKQLIVPKTETAKTPKTRRGPPKEIQTPKQVFIPRFEEEEDDDPVKQ